MKTENNKPLWWARLDGDLSADEQKEFERRLTEEPELAENYFTARRLEEQLKRETPEQPSLRFTKNVMEALPTIYRRIRIEPLLTYRALRRLGLGVLSLILLTLLPAFWTSGTGTPIPGMESILQFTANFSSLPTDWMLVIISLCMGFIAIVLLDQQLKRRLISSKNEVRKK
jgi:hypothetical protein